AFLLALLLRHRLLLLASFVLLVANGAAIYPHLRAQIFGPTPLTADAPPGRSLRLMTYNMHGTSTATDRLIELIRYEKPDIFMLTELPADLRDRLAPIEADYPHHIIGRSANGDAKLFTHEIAIYSRWPVAGLRTD